MFILAPLTSYLLFRDLRFWRFVRYFFPAIKTVYYQTALIIRDQNYRTMFSIPLTSPPMKQPDKFIVELAETWNTEENECRNCERCCQKLGCALFDGENGMCMSYDSFYWRYFNCGRYPATQKQIDYYECPKWIIMEKEQQVPNLDNHSLKRICNINQELSHEERISG
ncbi:MAG: hypothetical protein ABFD18_13250 [Syntrophomonas sp.]